VLLHELAHVQRGDWAAQLLARLACALYWFLPPVWWASARLRLEGERACDDAVLAAGIRPSDYAGVLLEVVTAMKTTRASLPAASMAAGPQIEDRLRAILDENRRRTAVTRRAAWCIALAAAAVLAPLATARVLAVSPAPESPVTSAAAPAPAPPAGAQPDPRQAAATAAREAERRAVHAEAELRRAQARLAQQSRTVQVRSRPVAGGGDANPLITRLRHELADVEIDIIRLSAEPRSRERERKRLMTLRDALQSRLEREVAKERAARSAGLLRLQLERKLADVEAQLVALRSTHVESSLEVRKLTALREALTQQLGELPLGETASGPAAPGELQAEVEVLLAQLGAARARIAELEATRAKPGEPRETEAAVRAQIEALKDQLGHLAIDMRAAESAYVDAKARFEGGQLARGELEAAQAKLEHVRLDLRSTTQKLNQSQVRLKELQEASRR
jgi:hypothetical protein